MNFKFQIRKCSSLALLIAFAMSGQVWAAQNPLNTILADHFDAKFGDLKLEACSEGGTNLASLKNGDYVVYKACDFDSGVAAFKARVSSITSGGVIEIRLDTVNGPLMGKCAFDNTGGWRDVTTTVDNSQAGVRDVYLIFRGDSKRTVANLRSFVFLKSVVANPSVVLLGAPDRVDDDSAEPQSTRSWGIPEAGFSDNFEEGHFVNWKNSGLRIVANGTDKGYCVESLGTNFNFAFTPEVYINKTDTGGQWRTQAEAALSAEITVDSLDARPGLGFSSKNGKQWVYVVLNAASNSMEAWRKLSDGSQTRIAHHDAATNASGLAWVIKTGEKYRLQVDWSPYSDGLIAFLYNGKGEVLTSFRTVIDLPAARRPLLVCSEGTARFGKVKFDPTLDSWNCKWEWKKEPILTPDVCNPAVWKWTDGKYYMMWRKFGQDTYHGIASSTDGIAWTRVTDSVLKCTGDMNVVVNPFGDGLVYITPGGNKMPWWTSDGSNNFTVWKKTSLTLGNIFGNSRIQEIIDTKLYPRMQPVHFEGEDYRFIGLTENWVAAPQPHTVVLLSNTLTNWVLANPDPVIPPGNNFWGEKGNAIGSAFVLPDGNILVASCSCTFDGYTGAKEPSNISAIVDGKAPWKVLQLGILPDAPVSRENVWYQGPNFGTAFYYEPENDTLFFYGGFHDYNIGVMRVQNFSHSKMAAKPNHAPHEALSEGSKPRESGQF